MRHRKAVIDRGFRKPLVVGEEGTNLFPDGESGSEVKRVQRPKVGG